MDLLCIIKAVMYSSVTATWVVTTESAVSHVDLRLCDHLLVCVTLVCDGAQVFFLLTQLRSFHCVRQVG